MTMSDTAFDRPNYLPPVSADRVPALVAGGALFFGFLAIAGLTDVRQAVLFLIGGLLGATLYHGSFGFTAAGGAWLSKSAAAASVRSC